MHKLITLRFALPAIVIVAIVTIALVAFVVVAHTYHGTVYSQPCC